MKTRSTRRILSAILLAVLFLAAVAPNAEAAAKKLKKQDFTVTYSKAMAKKATTVKKGTTTLLIQKSGYAKFVVPKTKKYTFTFSKMAMVKGFTSNGHAYLSVPTTSYGRTYMENREFSTAGGKTSVARYAVAKYADKTKTASASLATRSCKLKLKKGTTVYIYFYLGGSNDVTAKLNLKIK